MIGPLIWNKPGRPARIKIDGMRDIKVTRAVSRNHAGGWVGITVELLAREGSEKNEVVLTVPDETQAALLALGWTPPADDDEPGQVEPEPAPLGYLLVQGEGDYYELCAHGPDPIDRTPDRLRAVLAISRRRPAGQHVLCKLIPLDQPDEDDAYDRM